MTLYGNGRVVLVDDGPTADRLGWLPRRRSAPDPDLELVPVAGEPSLEPWLARDRSPRGSGPAALWSRSKALVPGPEAKAEWTYHAAEGKSKSRNTPFDGWTMQGKVRWTISEGRIAYNSLP